MFILPFNSLPIYSSINQSSLTFSLSVVSITVISLLGISFDFKHLLTPYRETLPCAQSRKLDIILETHTHSYAHIYTNT